MRSIYLFITWLRWLTLEAPFTIAWSLTDAYWYCVDAKILVLRSILKKQKAKSVIFAPQLFYQTELMTDSFNNNVTVSFLTACLFILAILSAMLLNEAEVSGL